VGTCVGIQATRRRKVPARSSNPTTHTSLVRTQLPIHHSSSDSLVSVPPPPPMPHVNHTINQSRNDDDETDNRHKSPDPGPAVARSAALTGPEPRTSTARRLPRGSSRCCKRERNAGQSSSHVCRRRAHFIATASMMEVTEHTLGAMPLRSARREPRHVTSSLISKSGNMAVNSRRSRIVSWAISRVKVLGIIFLSRVAALLLARMARAFIVQCVGGGSWVLQR